jgi:FkbM family methyltransferase
MSDANTAPLTRSAPIWVRGLSAVARRLPLGRYRLVNALPRGRPPFVAALPPRSGGLRFACDLRDAIAREACFLGSYEPQETALVRAILRPGATFVDVGANWGYFTLLGAAAVGSTGRVVSLEPDPRLFARLRENVALNGLDRVECLEVAAGEAPGELVLEGYDEKQDNWGLSKLSSGGASGQGPRFTVATRPLDALLEKTERVDLLKMDIEGAEDVALRGMRDGLARGTYRRVLLELHPTLLAGRGSSVEAATEPLVRARYTPLRIDHSPEANRRAAYERAPRPADYLAPAEAGKPLDAWPHVLWLAPGEAVPS